MPRLFKMHISFVYQTACSRRRFDRIVPWLIPVAKNIVLSQNQNITEVTSNDKFMKNVVAHFFVT